MSEIRPVCMNCGYAYREEDGDPDHGIPAGTPWDQVPGDWRCPDCGAALTEFETIDIG